MQGVARAVEYSARQWIYNIMDFKKKKEGSGAKISAEQIALFWAKNISQHKGGETFNKKSTIDCCLTIGERLFSLEPCERIIHQWDEIKGPDSTWNSVYKLQETVQRGKSPKNITWLVASIDDQLGSKKIADKDVTVGAIKSATAKTISDPILHMQTIKQYLLGDWLDSKEFPPYVKQRLREIFQPHASYRHIGSTTCVHLRLWVVHVRACPCYF